MSTPTATPRTDRESYTPWNEDQPVVMACFARTLETELAAAKAECAEKQATFDLMFSANLRGIKMWQDAHPEHSETWPDLAKLVAWLLSELARLRAELGPLRELVGVDSRAASALSDINHWRKLMDAWDDNARLRADLERFTGHGLLDCHAICDQRDAAIAERDRLRADNDRLRYDRLTLEGVTEMLKQEKARAERAEADTARLDWLERNGRFGYKTGTTWSDYFAVDLSGGQKTTIRAAIDAAMK